MAFHVSIVGFHVSIVAFRVSFVAFYRVSFVATLCFNRGQAVVKGLMSNSIHNILLPETGELTLSEPPQVIVFITKVIRETLK